MKYLKLILIAFLIVSCSDDENSSSTPETLNPLEAYQALDVSYGSESGQTFDVYLPANRTENTKILILVHGGGWSSGDKNDMNTFVDLILNELPNIGIVNINYRLADENNNPYPMQIDDITTIINDLKTKQDFYTISDDFGFIGLSAGAHLSLLWSYAFDTDSDIEMVCSIVGPTNFTDPAYLNNTSPIVQELIDTFGIDTSTDFLEEVSPFHQATSISAPTILFYGGQDPLIPTTQGTALRDRLVELGVTHDFTLYENEGHGWVGLNLLDTWLKLKAFIEIHLED